MSAGRVAQFSGRRCPLCGAELLTNERNDWCSYGCPYGLSEPIEAPGFEPADLDDPADRILLGEALFVAVILVVVVALAAAAFAGLWSLVTS